MVDKDAKFEFSNIIELSRRSSGEFAVTNLMPNPTNGTVRVEYDVEENVTVHFVVTDAVGRLIFTQQTAAVKGTNATTLDLTNLASGVYLIAIDKSGTERIVRKVIRN